MRIPVTTEYAQDFIEWLIGKIQYIILRDIDWKKLKPFSDYQEHTKLFNPMNTHQKKIDFHEVVMLGIQNLSYIQVKDTWIISIKQDISYPGYYARVYDICKFINYGLLQVKGYPIFTEAFNTVNNDLSKYYSMFLAELVL